MYEAKSAGGLMCEGGGIFAGHYGKCEVSASQST